MENQTSVKYFHILAFFSPPEKSPLIFLVFLLIYLLGVMWNSVIILVIYVDIHLHAPMYLFLSSLSCVDICYTTVTVPKLMDVLLSGDTVVSFAGCLSQMYFFIFMACTEDILLYIMAYDRYLAICKPLHYPLILNRRNCAHLVLTMWACGAFNSLFVTGFASRVTLCHSNTIHQYFCDVKALSKLSCADTGFHAFIYTETFIFGFCPFMCSLISYVKILVVILNIKSAEGRRKAFSTCSSHLTVLLVFYGTGVSVYMRPPSGRSDVLDQVFTVLYTAVIPVLNPLIYSLRNKEVKNALRRLVSAR